MKARRVLVAGYYGLPTLLGLACGRWLADEFGGALYFVAFWGLLSLPVVLATIGILYLWEVLADREGRLKKTEQNGEPPGRPIRDRPKNALDVAFLAAGIIIGYLTYGWPA